jgi:hypothetical protein
MNTNIRSQVDQALGAQTALRSQLAIANSKLDNVDTQWKLYETAKQVGTRITTQTRERVAAIFGGIGTSALRVIFSDQAEFSIRFDGEEDAKTRRAWLLVSDGNVAGDPTKKSGNSVNSVLSSLLRMAVVILHPGLSKFVALDEPLYGVNESKFSAVADVYRDLVDNHQLQTVVITHSGAAEFKEVADVVIEVSRPDPSKPSIVNIMDKRTVLEL